MKKKATAKTPEVLVPVPCYDHNRYTCLEIVRGEDFVKFIPLDVNDGLDVKKAKISEFDGRYKPIVNYPAEKAIAHFVRIAQTAGISKEAWDYLGRISPTAITQETEMPQTKKSVEAKAPAKEKPGAKSAAKTTTKSVTKPAAKPQKAMTAAARFQELIMEGKLSDEKIFQKVQSEFDLDDSKKGYVTWYRNHLKKKGMNPPEARK
jgi:hypothetical protein